MPKETGFRALPKVMGASIVPQFLGRSMFGSSFRELDWILNCSRSRAVEAAPVALIRQ